MSRIYLAYRSKKQRFCAIQAFCAAKPWRRANSLRPSISISCRNPKKSALLRRTSVLRSKTLAKGEFTSPEHFNFLPESKKEVTTYVVTSFLERATRLARSTAVPRHAQRATNAPPGRFLASLAPCSTLCPLEPKNKGMTYVMPLFFGAGDEARTRYLHLGKVALYQMSYARGTRCTIPDIFRFVKHRF